MQSINFQEMLHTAKQKFQDLLVSLVAFLMTYLIEESGRGKVIQNQLEVLLQEKKLVEEVSKEK